jgi:hypothetical protein
MAARATAAAAGGELQRVHELPIWANHFNVVFVFLWEGPVLAHRDVRAQPITDPVRAHPPATPPRCPRLPAAAVGGPHGFSSTPALVRPRGFPMRARDKRAAFGGADAAAVVEARAHVGRRHAPAGK